MIARIGRTSNPNSQVRHFCYWSSPKSASIGSATNKPCSKFESIIVVKNKAAEFQSKCIKPQNPSQTSPTSFHQAFLIQPTRLSLLQKACPTMSAPSTSSAPVAHNAPLPPPPAAAAGRAARIAPHSHIKGLGLTPEGYASTDGAGFVGQTTAREVSYHSGWCRMGVAGLCDCNAPGGTFCSCEI